MHIHCWNTFLWTVLSGEPENGYLNKKCHTFKECEIILEILSDTRTVMPIESETDKAFKKISYVIFELELDQKNKYSVRLSLHTSCFFV